MKKIWNNWLKESIYIFSITYTLVTILNSVLYLVQGYRDDPSGNWHELTRAGIVLIGVTAYELATKIPIKNCIKIPTKKAKIQFSISCPHLVNNLINNKTDKE